MRLKSTVKDYYTSLIDEREAAKTIKWRLIDKKGFPVTNSSNQLYLQVNPASCDVAKHG